MQLLRSHLLGRQIFNIQGGYDMASVIDILVRKDDLKVLLFSLKKHDDLKQTYYLMPDDIRQIVTQRILVDREDKISEADDLIRYSNDIKHPFTLLGALVVTVSGKKLGKVIDHSCDDQFFEVKKIYVNVGLWDKLLQDQLIIDRKDVVDVTDKNIVVRDNYAKSKQAIPNVLPAEAG